MWDVAQVPFALTAIKGIGRRFSFVCCRKADIDVNKRAGELSEEEVEKLMTVISNPQQYKIPNWFLNRQKDVKDGKFTQVHPSLSPSYPFLSPLLPLLPLQEGRAAGV